MNWMGTDISIQFFDYQADGKKFVIWGLTAHILTCAAAAIFQRQPSFAELRRPRYISSLPNTNNPEPNNT
jgi:peroxisomal coenzyme A diphosphatase NUDT7